MSEVKIIQGEIFQDHRGQISSLNEFHFDGVKRCYIIHHPDKSVIRGWHGYQFERKWFYCVKGKVTIALVKIDNWENPSHSLEAEIYHLTDSDSKLLCVPAGYANCLKAHIPNTIIQVFSDKILSEALDDSWRYDKDLWVNWDQFK